MSDNSYSSSYTVWTNGKQNTNSAQPVLIAYRSGSVTNVTGNGTNYVVPFNVALVDSAAGLNTTTGVYTIPKTGRYIGNTRIGMTSINSGHTLTIGYCVTTSETIYNNSQQPYNNADSSGSFLYVSNFAFQATAGDTMYIQFSVNNGSKTVGLNGAIAHFSCVELFLIG